MRRTSCPAPSIRPATRYPSSDAASCGSRSRLSRSAESTFHRKISMLTRRQAALALGGVAASTAMALTGCTPNTGSAGTATQKAVTQADIDKALNTPTTLTFWTWVPDIQKEIDLFTKKYPKITVKLVNTTGGAQHYPKLRSALASGKGIPDVAP